MLTQTISDTNIILILDLSTQSVNPKINEVRRKQIVDLHVARIFDSENF